MTKYSRTFYQGTGSVFITIITYRRPPEPRPVRHAVMLIVFEEVPTITHLITISKGNVYVHYVLSRRLV